MHSQSRSRSWARGVPGLAGLLVVTGLAACAPQVVAPAGEGLCWRMFEVADQKPRFEIVGRDVPNLESCAAVLEGARMMEGSPTSGAYNGHFIFVGDDQITSSTTLGGTRIRVFEPEDRRRLQEGVQTLIEHQKTETLPGS